MGEAGVWCVGDDHSEWDDYVAFNGWLESGEDEAILTLERLGIVALSSPSKALFVSDRPLYREEVARFRAIRRAKAMGDGTFIDHWTHRNRQRFDQILKPLRAQNVVPFVGAGVSCASDFPGWGAHLLDQAISSGYDADAVRAALARGEYEGIIEDIVCKKGEAVFIQELRDAFDRPPPQVDLASKIARLTDSLIATTNYDFVMQTAMNAIDGDMPELLNGSELSNRPLIKSMQHHQRSILMLHGIIDEPEKCIIRRTQYDTYYGAPLDLNGAVPKKLKALFEQRSLLFLGCSLMLDRTLSVFRKLREAIAEGDLPQHFAFVEAMADLNGLADRSTALIDLGITPIFYPKGRHDLLPLLIEELLEEVNPPAQRD